MYPEGEALVLTTLQGATGFSSTNTSRGKWGALLNSGVSDHYGILKPGSFSRSQSAMSANESIFQTVIQVWQRYVDDGDSLTNLEGHVKNVITRFDAYPQLGDTTGAIIEAMITDGREAEEQWTKDGALVWLKQDLIVTWREHDIITYSES